MPLDKFVLLIIIVMAAAAATVWAGFLIFALFELPVAGWFFVLPAGIVAYILWRIISERLTNKEDDYYDNIEK